VLHVQLGCAVHRAVAIADELLTAPTREISLDDAITLRFDRQAFERMLQSRLAEALEMAPRPRRGRPPARAARAG
jgi:hypothetical protein